MTTPHRVAIIGSGFGGLFSAQSLRTADVEITLIGRTTHHLFQPLLYQVATGILSPGSIAPSTREVLASQKNARVVLGECLRAIGRSDEAEAAIRTGVSQLRELQDSSWPERRYAEGLAESPG